MKLLFVCSAYPKDIYNCLYKDSKGVITSPMDVFQWALLMGFEGNGVDYNVVSFPSLPAWPRYRHLFSPKGRMIIDGSIRGDYIRYLDLPAIKQIYQYFALKKYIKKWCKDNTEEDSLNILMFTQQADKLGAIVKLKKSFKNLRITVIITDLIENAQYYASNRPALKRIQVWIEKKLEHYLFPHVDKYILLSQQMVDFIPEAIGRNIVVEGIANDNNTVSNPCDKDDNIEKVLLYTGILEEYAGINKLIDAFRLTTDPHFMFIVCGAGPSEDYVISASRDDPRIIYKGKVPHDDVIVLQKNATALINPRQPDGRITKYSFPSKTMEYMLSGTPMIGYKLEGIPEEYFHYMYIPEDLTVKKLSDCIHNTLSKPREELEAFAEKARSFVMDQKNSIAQVKRILDFMNNSNCIV